MHKVRNPLHAHRNIHARQELASQAADPLPSTSASPRVRRTRARCAVNADPPIPIAALGLTGDSSSVASPTSSAFQSVVVAPSALASSSKNWEEPAPSPEAPAPKPPTSSRLGQLFPVQGFGRSWSTCPDAPGSRDLSDITLRPGNVLRSTMYAYSNAPDGRRAIKAFFPQGSYTFTHQPQGGFSFYAPGPADVDLTTAKEATFGYSVFFPNGFAFNKGGKLPGFFGGNSYEAGTGCSGGRRDTACFSVRLMWRTDGAGEFYTYLPPGFDANNKLCNVPPFSECNPTYGASVGRGSFHFATGAWTAVAERVRLNDPGQSNGEIQLFVNGRSVLEVKGLVLRDSGSGKIRGIQAQTFFGGSKPEWASPKNQDLFFSDFSVAITQTF
ncbi:hypothetical protein BKA70DRAFT_1089281 [Coprinopsis sp. MPI-PUGE-AT-0042]|nr:hypothetical protein BKA70DRAFT_1089281 [Coprinopsis sp. MPI-PUGE-AT-0042]